MHGLYLISQHLHWKFKLSRPYFFLITERREYQLFFSFFFLNWSTVALLYSTQKLCVSFCCAAKWISHTYTIRSHQISRSVVSDSLRPHESQHARPPRPSPTPGVHSHSRPSSQWCHPAISSSVVPFSSCPQSLPASGSFPMCQLFAWGGQSTGVSASASFLPKKSQGWSPSEWTGWISLHLQPWCLFLFYSWKGRVC